MGPHFVPIREEDATKYILMLYSVLSTLEKQMKSSWGPLSEHAKSEEA